MILSSDICQNERITLLTVFVDKIFFNNINIILLFIIQYWCNKYFLLSLQLMLCEDTHGNKFLVKAIKNCDRPWISEEVICLFCFFFHMRVAIHWVIPEKIPTPTTEGMLENLTGGGG